MDIGSGNDSDDDKTNRHEWPKVSKNNTNTANNNSNTKIQMVDRMLKATNKKKRQQQKKWASQQICSCFGIQFRRDVCMYTYLGANDSSCISK